MSRSVGKGGAARGCGRRAWACCRGCVQGRPMWRRGWDGPPWKQPGRTGRVLSCSLKVLCDMTPRHIAVSLLMPESQQSGSGSDRPGSGTVNGAAPRPQGVSVR